MVTGLRLTYASTELFWIMCPTGSFCRTVGADSLIVPQRPANVKRVRPTIPSSNPSGAKKNGPGHLPTLRGGDGVGVRGLWRSRLKHRQAGRRFSDGPDQ